jgi:hypothetical protein
LLSVNVNYWSGCGTALTWPLADSENLKITGLTQVFRKLLLCDPRPDDFVHNPLTVEIVGLDGEKFISPIHSDQRKNMVELDDMVNPQFSMGSSRRIQAAVFSFIAGVIPPMPMLGRSLL